MTTRTSSRRGLPRDRPATGEHLDVEISCARGTASVTVTVDGDVDLATAPDLRQRLEAVLGEGVEDLVVDVSAVPFIDVAGLRVLLGVQSQLSQRDGRLTVIGSSRSLELVAAALGVKGLLSAG